jgi:hypothetical protein
VQYINVKQNLQNTRTKHLYVTNKLYEPPTQICIWFTNYQNKQLYIPNKLYELLEHICIRVEQILQTIKKTFICTKQIIWTTRTNIYTCRINFTTNRTKYFYVPNKLYKLQICIDVEQLLQTVETKNLYVSKKLYELMKGTNIHRGYNKYLKENNKYVKWITNN